MLQKFNPKNEDIKIFVGDKLYPRKEAKISVFDSAVQGGDAVWEGIRVYNGKIFCLHKHLQRLQASAKTMDFANVPSNEKIIDAIRQTLHANNMHNDTHIRLTLTRGEKITSGMDPRLNQKGCCLIVLAEFKPVVYDNDNGIRLITASVRRNSPLNIDSKIHHNNLINNILAKIEANHYGADDAIMLDNYGFVAETNACNIFMVKNNQLCTPCADACLPGITRQTVLDIAASQSIKLVEKNISISEFYNADEVFTTGTMGELTPVVEIDGRSIDNKNSSNIREQILVEYRRMIIEESVEI